MVLLRRVLMNNKLDSDSLLLIIDALQRRDSELDKLALNLAWLAPAKESKTHFSVIAEKRKKIQQTIMLIGKIFEEQHVKTEG